MKTWGMKKGGMKIGFTVFTVFFGCAFLAKILESTSILYMEFLLTYKLKMSKTASGCSDKRDRQKDRKQLKVE